MSYFLKLLFPRISFFLLYAFKGVQLLWVDAMAEKQEAIYLYAKQPVVVLSCTYRLMLTSLN